MSVRINFNASAVRAHFSLNQVDRQLATSLERLSSGVRIRRAADGPGDLILANQLRRNLVGVHRAIDNIGEGVSMLQVAEGGMGSAADMLTRARQLMLGALNEGANDPAMRAAYQAEYDNLMGSVERLATDTRFGNKSLLQGALSDNTLTPQARQVYTALRHDDTRLPGGVKSGSDLLIEAAGGDLQRASAAVTFDALPDRDAVITGQLQNGSALGSLVGESLHISGPRGDIDLPLSDTLTFRQLVGMINAASERTGVRADYDPDSGDLRLESLHFGGGAFAVSSGSGLLDSDPLDPTTNAFLSDPPNRSIDLTYTDESGVDHSLTLHQDPRIGQGLSFVSTAAQVSQTLPGTPDGSALLLSVAGLDELSGNSLDITGPDGNATIALNNGMRIDDLVAAINRQRTTTGVIATYDDGLLTVRQQYPSGGAFDIRLNDSHSNAFTLLDDDPGGPANNLINETTTNPEDWSFRLDIRDTSDGSLGSVVTAADRTHSASRHSTTHFQTGPLSGQRARIEVPDIRPGALGHGARNNASGLRNLADLSQYDILATGTMDQMQDALTVIDAAIDELAAARGSIGALVANGLESTLDTLRISSESLAASESLLRDTDFARESAAFARHNIIFQAATSMLAQANQMPQTVLQLLS